MGGRPSKGTKADGRLKENGGGKTPAPVKKAAKAAKKMGGC